MTALPKISVVTPNYNQATFIERTIQSVLSQNYPNLEYIVIDGGSNDGSVEVIKKYEDQLHYWESAPDKGMYDAINKGFSRSSGEIMCWINSDDMLAPGSLDYVAKAFQQNSKVNWLMGFPTIINEQDEITWQGQDAKVFNPLFFYLHNHLRSFSFIQQESCFWRRELWEKSGGALSLDYNLGSDFDLWLRFFKHDKLYFSKKQLSAFRRRTGQKSENQTTYMEETNLSVAKNQKLLGVGTKAQIFMLKSLRTALFSFRNKWVKNRFYAFQNWVFGKPTFIKEPEV